MTSEHGSGTLTAEELIKSLLAHRGSMNNGGSVDNLARTLLPFTMINRYFDEVWLAQKALNATIEPLEGHNRELIRSFQVELDLTTYTARNEYNKVRTPALNKRNEAIDAAEKAYTDTIDAAEKAYKQAVASAREVYDKAVASVQVAHLAAIAPAKETYREEATAILIKLIIQADSEVSSEP